MTQATMAMMTKTNMDLSVLVTKQEGGDFLRSVVATVLRLVIEADVDGLICLDRHEWGDNCTVKLCRC